MVTITERPNGHEPDPMDRPLKLGLARLANGISPGSVSMAYADWLTHLLGALLDAATGPEADEEDPEDTGADG